MNLSLAGCGFLGIYHAGVASCFKEYAPNVLVHKISGTSAGALAAASLICGCSMGQVTSDILKIAISARKYTLGPFNPKFSIVRVLRERLDQILPENAHVICTDRLFVSVTRVSDGQNVILSHFDSKEELIQALLCSSYIPIFSGIVPEKFRGVRYIDGCYSNNLPILDENTVTVSPFCGESDICPRDNSYNLFQVNFANTSIELSPQNMYRLMRILFPPHPEILSEMCRQGFDDALRFLQTNNMIACTRCIAVSSVLEIKEDDDAATDTENEEEEEDSCEECRQRKEMAALSDDLPEAVVNVLEEATLAMNNGFVNWVFKHKTIRVLSILTIPYVLPFDIVQAAYARFKEMLPKLGHDLNVLAAWLVKYLKNAVHKLSKDNRLYCAKFNCQLSVTEYDFAEGVPNKSAVKGLQSAPVSRRGSTAYTVRTVRPRSGDWGSICCPHKDKQQMTPSNASSRRSSCFNFGFSVDVAGIPASSSKPLTKAMNADRVEEKAVDLANAALTLDPTVIKDCDSICGEHVSDTFDQMLQVTKQHEAIMAYYYLDENNQVKVTEIFDATDPDVGAVLSPDENEVNRNLDWDESFVSLKPDNMDELYSKLESDLTVYDSTDYENSTDYAEMTSVDCSPRKDYLSLTDV